MNQPEIYPTSEIAETLALLVKSLVRNPTAVKITTSVHASLVVFLIKVEQDDVKRVVGQKGRHFKALETTVKALAKLISLEAHLSLDESMPAVIANTAKTHALGTGDSRLLESLPALLERLVEPFIEDFDALKVEVTERGVVEAARLYESPFTDIAPRGPDGLFKPADIEQLFQILDDVRAKAGA